MSARAFWGIVLSIVIGTPLFGQDRPRARTPAEAVLERLQAIPAFVLMDSAGAPFLAGDPKGNSQVLAFLRKSLAESAVAEVRRADARGARKLVIRSIPLSELVKRFKGGAAPIVLMVPDPEEVTNAARIFVAAGKKEPLKGVPLFVAKAEGKGYLNVTQNGRTFVPIFFSLAELEQLRAQVRSESAKRAGGPVTTTVDVLSLESLLDRWKATKDPTLGSITLVPSAKALAEAKP